MCSKSVETPTNGDGFGVGWYGSRPRPGVFRSIRPAWNDFNLRDLAAQIESPLFLAHVRATSHATVQETNCHPFRYGKWLFVHNGEIFEIEKLRRKLLFAVAPQFFPNVLGSTDSEVMFHLALTFGLEADPLGALARMAGFVENAGREEGIAETLWMTLGVSDGDTLYVVRYASDGDAPTLYHSRDMEEVYEINPALRDRLAPITRVVVSEPIGSHAETWLAVDQGASLTIREGEAVARPFVPISPA
jgi:glutamine amidotransferase